MADDHEPPETLAPPELDHWDQLRRSPHPYHRHQNGHIAGSSSSSLRTALGSKSHTISDEDGRKRRRLSQSPSASGTEADDEGYTFVKALPAPPLRPQKGLRDVRGTGLDGDATPLLTPSQVDEEGRQYSAEYFKARKSGSRVGTPAPIDEEARAARKKYRRRRRNELIRRTTETALLGVIGTLAVYGCCCWKELLKWHKELLTFGVVISSLLFLYPFRLFLYSRRREPDTSIHRRPWLRVPSAFDPATILYPTALPVLICISLYPSLEHVLLPNIILGLAAMPARLIPYSRSGFKGFSSLHWLLSILPLFISENTDVPSKLSASLPYKLKLPPAKGGLDPEILVCLFALHQALLPPLFYLTTTSLLPTELQLLSVGIINLFLFAKSPQAVILKALLWVGGLGLFVLCGKVLRWGVALARIPRWRFKHAAQVARTRQSFIIGLLERRSKSAHNASSDSEMEDLRPIRPLPLKKSLKKTRDLTLNILSGNKQPHLANGGGNGTGPSSAIESSTANHFSKANDSDTPAFRERSNTLPTLPTQDTIKHHRTRAYARSTVQAFLSLTPRQAMVRKWLYAGYFYVAVIVLILGPIRYIIQHYALNGHEPFGWAIGYLFGNLRPLRFWVVHHGLDTWISLPPLRDAVADATHSTSAGWVSQIVAPSGVANTRLALTAYCLLCIITGLSTVLFLTPHLEVDTRRKVFHFTMVALLLPTIPIDPCFVALALSLVLAIFLLLDLIRASQLPPLSRPIALFLTPYVDGRDLRGPVVVSHIFLLIGCAIPLWLSLAGAGREGEAPWEGWSVLDQRKSVDMLAGVVCVGMGDAAASLVGRRWGRRKWPWAGGKSLEGSAAFACAVLIGILAGKMWLRMGGWERDGVGSLGEWVGIAAKAVVCAAGASLNEAVLTGGNDNVVVPVLLWVLVRGVGL